MKLRKVIPLYKDIIMKIGSAVIFSTTWILATSVGQAQSVADNWHQWRGPENNGVSRTADPPVEWSEEKNVAWKIEIGGHGTSSPIVWGNKVFVTTAVNTEKVDPSLPKPEDQPERVFGIKHPNTSYQMMVLCIDKKTGQELWRDVAKTLVPNEGHHRDASFASASPFCDDKRIYFWFGSGGLFAYSHDGKKLWERDLGKVKVGASLGEGSSPLVHDGKMVIVRDNAGQSTIEVLDASNGKPIWRKDRDELNAWATPAIAKYQGVTQVITCASNKVRSYNLINGEIIWEAQGLTSNCIPCPIVHEEVVYCMSGYKGYSLLAIPITGKGDVTDSVLWKVMRGTPYIPSPLLYDGLLYFTQSNQNLMTCVDIKDGSQVIEKDRLPGLGGIYSSPVGAAGRIYMTDRKGTVLVLKRGDKTKVLATNQLDDDFHASPALAGKKLFLRGRRFLYCLEEEPALAKHKVASKQHAEKKVNQSTSYRGSYYVNGEIHVNIYGQPEGKAITTGHHDFKPSWSKTGDLLVFFRRVKNDPDVSKWKTAIHIINVDGTGLHKLTDGSHTDFNQTWTRDGKNTPIWNRKNPKTGGYVVMASKVGAKPGEEISLTDKGHSTWAYSCLTDGRILVRSNPPGQGMGYYLMTVRKDMNPLFERVECELGKIGVLSRISFSPTETRVCFEFQRGFKRRVKGRTLYVADFDAKSRKIANAKPFANQGEKPIWFAYPRWSNDESSIVYQAGGKLYLYKPQVGLTYKVSTDDKSDYRYPHFEDIPK